MQLCLYGPILHGEEEEEEFQKRRQSQDLKKQLARHNATCNVFGDLEVGAETRSTAKKQDNETISLDVYKTHNGKKTWWYWQYYDRFQ